MYYYSRYLGVTILLSLTVFLNMVAETMPATSDAVPLLGKMILFTNLTGVLYLLNLLYTIYYVICILVILNTIPYYYIRIVIAVSTCSTLLLSSCVLLFTVSSILYYHNN